MNFFKDTSNIHDVSSEEVIVLEARMEPNESSIEGNRGTEETEEGLDIQLIQSVRSLLINKDTSIMDFK